MSSNSRRGAGRRPCAAAALMALFGAVSGTGCAHLAYAPFSRPAQVLRAEGAHASDRGGFLYLRMGAPNRLGVTLDEFDLVLRSVSPEYRGVASGPVLPLLPWPWRWWRAGAPGNTLIEVRLAPKRPLSFRPRQTALLRRDGSRLQAASFIGPELVDFGFHAYAEAAASTETHAVFLPPGRWSCFVLRFDGPQPGEWEFDLLLEGIETPESPLAAPAIRFEKARAWFVFWGGRERFCAE